MRTTTNQPDADGEFLMKVSEFDQEALEYTVRQMSLHLPRLYVTSTVLRWLETGLQPITDIGQEVVRVYEQCLYSRD